MYRCCGQTGEAASGRVLGLLMSLLYIDKIPAKTIILNRRMNRVVDAVKKATVEARYRLLCCCGANRVHT